MKRCRETVHISAFYRLSLTINTKIIHVSNGGDEIYGIKVTKTLGWEGQILVEGSDKDTELKQKQSQKHKVIAPGCPQLYIK